MKEYKIDFEMPCVKTQTISVVAETEAEAITVAKDRVTFDASVMAQNTMESPQVVSITTIEPQEEELDAKTYEFVTSMILKITKDVTQIVRTCLGIQKK